MNRDVLLISFGEFHEFVCLDAISCITLIIPLSCSSSYMYVFPSHHTTYICTPSSLPWMSKSGQTFKAVNRFLHRQLSCFEASDLTTPLFLTYMYGNVGKECIHVTMQRQHSQPISKKKAEAGFKPTISSLRDWHSTQGNSVGWEQIR